MFNFDEPRYEKVVSDALALRPQIEAAVDKVCEQGYSNIFFIGCGGTWAHTLPMKYWVETTTADVDVHCEIAAEFLAWPAQDLQQGLGLRLLHPHRHHPRDHRGRQVLPGAGRPHADVCLQRQHPGHRVRRLQVLQLRRGRRPVRGHLHLPDHAGRPLPQERRRLPQVRHLHGGVRQHRSVPHQGQGRPGRALRRHGRGLQGHRLPTW